MHSMTGIHYYDGWNPRPIHSGHDEQRSYQTSLLARGVH